MLACLIVLSLTATLSLGSGIGKCPEPATKADFDLEKFAGTWYEIESTRSVEGALKKCPNYLVEFKSKNKATVLHKYISTISGKSKSEYSEANAVKSSEPGKLQITPLKGTASTRKWTMRLIDTDYETFGIGYACHQLLPHVYREEAFIFSRSKTLDDKQKMDLYEIMKKNKLPMQDLVAFKQDDKDCKEKEEKE